MRRESTAAATLAAAEATAMVEAAKAAKAKVEAGMEMVAVATA